MKHLFSASALLLVAACGQRVDAPGRSSALAGYVHTYEHSRFHVGDVLAEKDELGMHKIVGTVGTFSTQLVSKAAVGMRDLPWPDPYTGVYPGDADAQNAAVRSYFVSAGLPEDQIASLSANGTAFVQGDIVLAGSYSRLHRGVGDVAIVDSLADAAFDASVRSAFEQVYWPEIPGEALDQAHAFQDMFADPVQKAAYIQKLPASSRPPEPVIRHTSWYWQGAFHAHACSRGPRAADLCFDMSGHPLPLPDDVAAAGPGSDRPGESDIVCPTSDSGRFSETPSGACEGTGACAIELEAVCRPGVSFVPSTPPVFVCQCEQQQWHCVVKSGGLGVVPCEDTSGPD